MLADEINTKSPGAGNTSERNTEADADKSASHAASQNKEAVGKEESSETTAPVLSPELAAMIANLLQRQTAPAEAAAPVDGESAESDPLALLGKPAPRQASDIVSKDKGMPDPRLSAANDRAAPAPQTINAAKPELDLQMTAAVRQPASDGAASDAQPQEFNTVLQQLTQTNQAAARPAQAAQPHIAPRVGTQGWDQAIGQRVVWMASNAEQSASLTLNPPELGPLQVTVNVSNNQANATFMAANADVRQALESALPKLREMLGEVGIQLGQASVNEGAPQQQGEFARSSGQGGSQAERGSHFDTPAGEAPVSVSRISTGNGLVDTFA